MKAGQAASRFVFVLLSVGSGRLGGSCDDLIGAQPRDWCGSCNGWLQRVFCRVSTLVPWVIELSTQLLRGLGSGLCALLRFYTPERRLRFMLLSVESGSLGNRVVESFCTQPRVGVCWYLYQFLACFPHLLVVFLLNEKAELLPVT